MTSTNMANTEERIDLVEMLKTGWDQRRVIIICTTIFGILSIALALMSPKEYAVVTKLVPNTSDGSGVSSSGLGGLASLAGINLGGAASSGGEIPLNLYPEIVKSVPFKLDLLNMKVNSKRSIKPLTVREYKMNYSDKNILTLLKRYTIGLPGIIKRGLGDEPVVAIDVSDSGQSEILSISYIEMKMLQSLSGQLELEVNEREGIIIITSRMPEPLMAAQLAQKAQMLLQEKVTEFRIQKAKQELEFTENLHFEKESSFRSKQAELASFRDQNQNITSSVARNEQERLESEYDLALSIFNEFAKQLESARIKVKKSIPSFSILEPVIIPIEPTKPKRKIMVLIGIFVGFIFGILLIVAKQLYKELKLKLHSLNSQEGRR